MERPLLLLVVLSTGNLDAEAKTRVMEFRGFRKVNIAITWQTGSACFFFARLLNWTATGWASNYV